MASWTRSVLKNVPGGQRTAARHLLRAPCALLRASISRPFSSYLFLTRLLPAASSAFSSSASLLIAPGSVGVDRTASRFRRRQTSFRQQSSVRLAPVHGEEVDVPVTLPPVRVRLLATSPLLHRSLPTPTDRESSRSRLGGEAASALPGWRSRSPTAHERSARRSPNRPYCPLAQRQSRATFCPSCNRPRPGFSEGRPPAVRLGRGPGVEIPINPITPASPLLRPRRERPRRRAAEARINSRRFTRSPRSPSSTMASIPGGKLRPNALAVLR